MDTEKPLKTQFQGRLIEYRPITDAQSRIIMALRNRPQVDPDDTEAYAAAQLSAQRDLDRLFRVIESRVSKEEWRRIDEDMVMGAVEMVDIMTLLGKMMKSPAKDQDKPA